MIISFANLKGGVGKTTICCNTAAWLKRNYVKNLLAIDMDPQRSLQSWLEKIDVEFDYHYSPLVKAKSFDPNQVKLFWQNYFFRKQKEYDAIIIDLPGGQLEDCLPIIEMSDRIVIPCSDSTIEIEATIKVLDFYQKNIHFRDMPRVYLIPAKILPQVRHINKFTNYFKGYEAIITPRLSLYNSLKENYGRTPVSIGRKSKASSQIQNITEVIYTTQLKLLDNKEDTSKQVTNSLELKDETKKAISLNYSDHHQGWKIPESTQSQMERKLDDQE